MDVDDEANFGWLDAFFAKKFVNDFEAACVLAGYSEDDEEVIIASDSTPNDVNIISPIVVRRIYKIIHTWQKPNGTTASPLWYMEQGIIHDVPYLKFDLLLPKCLSNDYRKKQILDGYPVLAGKSNIEIDPTVNDPPEDDYDESLKDRNDRLFRRAVEIAVEKYSKPEDISLSYIHNEIEREEKIKSKITIYTLKHVVKLERIKIFFKKHLKS